MEVDDFVENYAYLYVCRLLRGDWVEKRLKSAWKGRTAEGLPTPKNRCARLDLNPQFKITVSRPCDGFVMMKQFDEVNMFKG